MNSTTTHANGNRLTPRDLAMANVKATLRHFKAEAHTPWLRAVAAAALADLDVIEAAPAPARTLIDGGPDFEDAAPFTPLEILARNFALPPIAGGAPEPYQPSEADWSDYHAYCELQDSLDMREDAHRCGMAV